MKHFFTKISIVMMIMTCFGGNLLAQTIRYVKTTATGTGNGSNWDNASDDLQAIINASDEHDEVWVATGTYKPERVANDVTGAKTPDNRDNSFVLKSGVKVYGGFPGSGNPGMADRNFTTYETVLSGNIGDAGIETDNAYHVIISADNNDKTVLDGFTVKEGYSNFSSATTISINGQSVLRVGGAGIYVIQSLASFKNLKITGNICEPMENGTSTFGGAGMSLRAGSSPTIEDSEISGNHSRRTEALSTRATHGGGVMIWGSTTNTANPIFNNVIISGNTAKNNGGGIYMNAFARPVFNKITVSDNVANSGAGLYTAGNSGNPNELELTNAKFLNNTATGSDSNNGLGGAIHTRAETSIIKLENLLFYNNEAYIGGAIYYSRSANAATSLGNIIGNTFYKNKARATTGAGAVHYGSSTNVGTIPVYNSLFIDNEGGTDRNNIFSNGATINVYNSAFNGTGTGTPQGESVITDAVANVIFASTTPEDFNFLYLRPVITNPAIDSGDDDAATLTIDLAGNTRSYGDAIDMGAYENTSTLPVTLTYFNAKSKNNSVLIEWSTESEWNNDYFIIERSANGANFTFLSKVESTGNGSSKQDYYYTDNSPLPGINYYRLKQVDKNGTVTTYDIKSVDFSLSASADVTIYPNPVTNGEISVNLNGLDIDKIEIANLYGKVFYSETVSKNTDTQTINISRYSAGNYLIRLTGKDGNITKKIIKL